MKFKFTMASNYHNDVKMCLQHLQDYEQEENFDSLKQACIFGAFAAEKGIMLIARHKLNINIYQAKDNEKTRRLCDVIKDVYAKLSNNGECFSSNQYSSSPACIRNDILRNELPNIISLRNKLAHNSGSIDDKEVIQDLIRILTFINMLIPYENCMHAILDDIDLKDYYVKLSRSYSTQQYIIKLRELRATNRKESEYLPSDAKCCENCKNYSAQIFTEDACIIHGCPLCEYYQYFYECVRCGNHHDPRDERGVEINADENCYICEWCISNYLNKE